MSFSASTCITNIGSANLGPTLKIYKNPISPTNNGVYVQDVSTSLITGANCPYTYLLDDDATSVRIFDPSSYCYVDFTVTEGGACVFCDLSLNNVSNNLIGTINVGNLTGSCDPTITDYKIAWYGPNSSTNVAFTSGKGTLFPGYTSPHPLTGSSAPLLMPGVYESRITDVELNGIKYSVTGGTGTGSVLSSGLTACSLSFNVSAFTCNNGTYGGPYYTHRKTFQTDGDGTTPQSLSTVFELSAGTEFFIYQFQGFVKYDNLKITYSGASSPEPLILENIRIGTNPYPGNNLLFTSAQRSFNTGEIKRILPLSGITINSGDILIIEITPYNLATDTSWDLKFGCYSNPTLDKTCFDTYKNNSYKIVKSTINTVNYGSCAGTGVTFNITGCTTTDKSNLDNSPLGQFGVNGSYWGFNQATGPYSYNTGAFYNSQLQQQMASFGCGGGCVSTVGNTITIEKTTTSFNLFFESPDDCSAYYNSYLTGYNYLTTSTGYGLYSTDPTNIGYYRYLKLAIPSSSCGPNAVCDNCSSVTEYFINTQTVVVTGTTSGGYFMTISLPLMTDGYTCSTCEVGCPSATLGSVSSVNYYATGITFTTRTYNNGLRQQNPFCYNISYTSVTSNNLTNNITGYITLSYDYFNKVIPQSGNTYTLTPQYSADTINWLNHFYLESFSENTGQSAYRQNLYRFKVTATSLSPYTFKIYAKNVVDWGKNLSDDILFPWIEVYDSTNPSASDPNFVT